MGRKPALGTVQNAFFNAALSSHNLFTAAQPFCQRTYEGMNEAPLHPNQARRIVALAFLAMASAWEEFLEGIFVRYLAGAASQNGYKPTGRGCTAVNLDHSYELLTGQLNYDPSTSVLSWSSPTRVIERAEIFFYQGQPFKGALGKWQSQLQDGVKIRNRVAHSSSKCRSDFKVVALRLLARPPKSKLTQGYSAGDLLLDTHQVGFDQSNPPSTYFEEYFNMYVALAAKLAP
jgi:hypothetical protein